MKTTTLIIGDENGLRGQGLATRANGGPGRWPNPGKFDPEFGKEVKRRRKELGVTQEELANRAAISPVTLSRAETATNPLTESLRGRIEAGLQSIEDDY